MTADTLIKHLNLMVEGHKFHAQDIWNVTVAASAQCQATVTPLPMSSRRTKD